MYILLLAVIYLAFVSLGLPDGILGAAWPEMHQDLNVPTSFAGYISMIIAFGTILSSLNSDRLIRRFSTWGVTSVSVLMTALSLLGFAYSSSVWMLCLIAIPYGLGAGSVDAALNNYVATHYKAKHMSWLHCFWGLGATVGPFIMGAILQGGNHWSFGYKLIFLIQIVLTFLLFSSFKLWKKKSVVLDNNTNNKKEIIYEHLPLIDVLKTRGVIYLLLAFFFYCSLESMCGLWGATYMVNHLKMDSSSAATFTLFFYLGIALGRFISGFVSMKLNDKSMVRIGLLILLIGVIILLIPNKYCACIGLLVSGLGCAPIYPCLIHTTPNSFKVEHSQSIIGVQMASAYIGTTFMPFISGKIIENIGFGMYPIIILIFAICIICMVHLFNRFMKNNKIIKEKQYEKV